MRLDRYMQIEALQGVINEERDKLREKDPHPSALGNDNNNSVLPSLAHQNPECP